MSWQLQKRLSPRPWLFVSLANTVDSPDQTKKYMDSDKWTLSQLCFCHCCQLTPFGMILIFGCVEGNWNCHAELCHGSLSFSVKFPHLKKKKSYFRCKYFYCETRKAKRVLLGKLCLLSFFPEKAPKV